MTLRALARSAAAIQAVSVCLAASGFPPQTDDVHALSDPLPFTRDHRAIQYTARPTTDPAARLNQRLDNRQVRFEFDAQSGYLKPLLAALNIPVESQTAVFSKTSLQSAIIAPENPRLIFFGDAAAVAWPRGGFIEIASVDPEQGTIFYRLAQVPTTSPSLVRNDATCLNCHATDATLGVPGLAMASVVPEPDGLVASAPTRITDHRTPIAERWGGWLVTAKRMPMPHLGNLVASDASQPTLVPTPASIERATLSLASPLLDTAAYPSAHSDVVALMVLGHQARMVDLITRIGWETRVAQSAPPGTAPPLADWARELVDYMLFIDEAPLSGPIEGSSRFAERFASIGPRDAEGRSLRDFDLRARLFRYPCSYMIYSDQFDHLPVAAREAVYRRLQEVLSGADRAARYARLSPADRQAIRGILRETKKDAAAYLR